eukprot:gene17019-17263_t
MSEVLLCNELANRAGEFVDKPVRVLATITRFDARAQIALVELKGGSAVINTEVCDKI